MDPALDVDWERVGDSDGIKNNEKWAKLKNVQQRQTSILVAKHHPAHALVGSLVKLLVKHGLTLLCIIFTDGCIHLR